MKVRVKVTSTKENVLDIGSLRPGLIKELILQDSCDGSFLGDTDWSVDENSIGDTVYSIENVEIEEIKPGKRASG